jgi:hypothetical protein
LISDPGGLSPGESHETDMKLKSMGIKKDPKMEVLYHIRPYFVGIFPYIGLT